MSGAYYSEFDQKAAAWLRELIKRGLIADGEVDERDLWDVSPDDLRGFTQVHLCAGIGVWSYAARCAGWPDDRPVWTASFPCQPFSQAGKGRGFADERHLWPAGLHLIREHRPAIVFGEQVSSKDGLAWFDLVQADLEGEGYAVGALDTCAAGVGAPHIRQRLYWVADTQGAGRRERSGHFSRAAGASEGEVAGQGDGDAARANSSAMWLAHHHHQGLEGRSGEPERAAQRAAGAGSVAGGLAEPDSQRRDGEPSHLRPEARGRQSANHIEAARGGEARGPAGPVNGLWRDADWLLCRDGKWRPVEPGTFPLAHGAPARVGRLRGYGNAIVAPAAQAFVEAYLEATPADARGDAELEAMLA